MEWIQELSQNSQGALLLRTLDLAGAERFRPINELPHTLQTTAAKHKRNAQADFKDLHRISPQEAAQVAQALGFRSVICGQAIYAFDFDGLRYLLPASVLMCSVFRPFSGIVKYLLAPQGLDNLCIPYGNVAEPEMLFFFHVTGSTGIQLERARGIINSLSWAHCFPSGKRLWSSVREYARSGQLDVDLPTGELEFLGTGIPLQNDVIFLTELRIRLLKTAETPYPAYSAHTREIEFERVLHKLNKPRSQPYGRSKEMNTLLRDGFWELSDDEWNAIERTVGARLGRASTRSRLNILLRKCSQGLPWAAVSSDATKRENYRQHLARMRSNGSWDALVNCITTLREP